MNAMMAEKWRKCIFSKRNFVEKVFYSLKCTPSVFKQKKNIRNMIVFLTLKCMKGVEI